MLSLCLRRSQLPSLTSTSLVACQSLPFTRQRLLLLSTFMAVRWPSLRALLQIFLGVAVVLRLLLLLEVLLHSGV